MPSDTRQLDQRSGGGSGTAGDFTRRIAIWSSLYSGLAPEAFTTGVHFSSSALTKAPYSAGVLPLDSAPISSQRFTTSGSFRTTCISRAMRSTIGAGVRAGADTPNQE